MLQREGGGGDHHAVVVEQRRHEVGQRLAGAGARLHQEVTPAGEGVGHLVAIRSCPGRWAPPSASTAISSSRATSDEVVVGSLESGTREPYPRARTPPGRPVDRSESARLVRERTRPVGHPSAIRGVMHDGSPRAPAARQTEEVLVHHNVLARFAAPLVGAALVAAGLATPALAADRDLGSLSVAESGQASPIVRRGAARPGPVDQERRRQACRRAAHRPDHAAARPEHREGPALAGRPGQGRRLCSLARPTPVDTGILDYADGRGDADLRHARLRPLRDVERQRRDAPAGPETRLDVMEHVWGVYSQGRLQVAQGRRQHGWLRQVRRLPRSDRQQRLLRLLHRRRERRRTRRCPPTACSTTTSAEFTDHTPQQNLQVTAAHEFFHADPVQLRLPRGPLVHGGHLDLGRGRAL